MTLSDKERYVFHMAVTMTLAITADKKFDLKQVEKAVLTHRARHITEEELEELRENMHEEMLVGQTLYEEVIAEFMGADPEKFK